MKKAATFLFVLALLFSVFAASTVNGEADIPEGAVTVDNVNAFLDAVSSDTVIVLEPGVYNLSKADTYGKAVSGSYSWESLGSGQYTLCINDISGLTIIGKNAEIVTDPRWAVVMNFSGCYGLTLKGLTLGHTEAAEPCEGGVLNLNRCDKATVENCSFYGCGTIGIELYDCRSFTSIGSDIHHCSSCALFISDCRSLSFENTRVHDIGVDHETFRPWCLFAVNTSENVVFNGCEVSSNDCSTVFAGNSDKLVFNDLSMNGTTADTVFSFNGRLDIDGVSMDGNSFNRWFDRQFSTTLVINGQLPDETRLNERYTGQLKDIELGDVRTEKTILGYEGCKEIHVSTADEFLAAIGSDTHIIIDVPQIDLTSAADYGSDSIEFYDSPSASVFSRGSYAWQTVYDGNALWIGKVSNFHISGGEIITQPRYANVLNFYDCSDSSISSLTAGHSPEQGACVGGVINLLMCHGFVIDNCDLYGCGIYGLEAEASDSIVVQDTFIHDCSYGAARVEKCRDLTFMNLETQNCPSWAYTFTSCDNLVWNDKLIDGTCSFDDGPSWG